MNLHRSVYFLIGYTPEAKLASSLGVKLARVQKRVALRFQHTVHHVLPEMKTVQKPSRKRRHGKNADNFLSPGIEMK